MFRRWRFLTSTIPGLVVAGVVMKTGFYIADRVGEQVSLSRGLDSPSPVSGIPVCILLGMSMNTLLLKKSSPRINHLLSPGLQLCTKSLLRIGIVCVGVNLSLYDVAQLGVYGVPMVGTCIASGIGVVSLLTRVLQVPTNLGVLIGVGSSICGVTAITAVAPLINASKQHVAFAVANIVLFGLLGMTVYPYLANYVFDGNSKQVGMFLGTAIHDTSQVMGAALSYQQLYDDDEAFKTAAVTKLTRNMFLALVIPYIGWKYSSGSSKLSFASISKHTPGFVVAFVCMSLVRTLSDHYLREDGSYTKEYDQLVNFIGKTMSKECLGVAMASLGLQTDLAMVLGVGIRPLSLGVAGAFTVASVGMLMSLLTGDLLIQDDN